MTVIATAFGLDVTSAAELSFLKGAVAKPTGRVLALSALPHESASGNWPAEAELICDERLPDGGPNFSIERHATAGYLISGPAYGAHLLSADASSLRCFPEARPDGAWQRLLIAQVLPFAALLRGLEVLHASAIVWEKEMIAFVGPSGAGKTSLALELCRRGACFMADDVLALELVGSELLAHPGSPIASVDRNMPSERVPAGTDQERVLATNPRERLVAMRGAEEPAALSTLFFLDRRTEGPQRPQFQPSTDAQSLLAATFNFVLATPERLERLLDVCAQAARLRVEQVQSGPATDPGMLADAIENRLSTR